MKIKYYNYLLALSLCFSMIIPSSTNISGQVEYFYMLRLENAKLINIPFRLLDFDIQHQVSDNFNVFGNIGIEYRNRRDTDFMTDSNLEDFLIDIRELYMSMYIGDGEVRIGKQIHSWGSVDENSPIDNLNAYDYYYLLLGGAEKKLGAYSMAYDNYIPFLDNCKFSLVYSPMHNTSRIPINDPDYPIGLPEGVSPSSETTVLNDVTLGEYGLNFKWSFDFGDISLSHLGMYDRIFNLTGVNVYTNSSEILFEAVPFYSYRLTKALSFGGVFLFDDFTLRVDFARFNSEDKNTADDLNVPHPDPDKAALYSEFALDPIVLQEKAKYQQTAIQLEPFL